MTKIKTVFAFILVTAPCFVIPVISLLEGKDNVFLEIAKVVLKIG